MKKPAILDTARYYRFQKHGKEIIVISRMGVMDFEYLHSVWITEIREIT